MAEPCRSAVAPFQLKRNISSVWDSLSRASSYRLSGRVTSVAVSNKSPYKYAIPNGRCVNIYKASSNKLVRRVTGFGKRVECVDFRADGKLIAAGEEEGVLRLCTTDKNTFHLRKIQAHTGSVTKTAFLCNGFSVASLGVDAYLRLWDVSTGNAITKFAVSKGQEPAVALAVSRCNETLVSCGNMQGRVFIYDIRQKRPAQTIQLPRSVSAVAFAGPDDNTLLAASLSWLYAWDIGMATERSALINSSAPVTLSTCSDEQYPKTPSLLPIVRKYNGEGKNSFTQDKSQTEETPIEGCLIDNSCDEGVRRHFKMITDIKVTQHPVIGGGEVMVSVGMDRMIKVTSLNDFSEVHTLRSPSAVLSVGLLPDCTSVILGCENGFVRTHNFPADPNKLLEAAEIDATTEGFEKTKNSDKLNLEENELTGTLGGDLDELVAQFSGRWRGGSAFSSDLLRPVDEWLEDRLESVKGTALAPKGWLPGDSNKGEKPPIVHPETQSSIATLRAAAQNRRQTAADRALRGRLTKADNFLRHFDHSRALSQALLPLSSTVAKKQTFLNDRLRMKASLTNSRAELEAETKLAMAVIQELYRRGTLSAAVAGRTPSQLVRLLKFIIRHVARKDTATICLLLYNTVLDVYSSKLLSGIKEFLHATKLIRMCSDNLNKLSVICKNNDEIKYSFTGHVSDQLALNLDQTNTHDEKQHALKEDKPTPLVSTASSEAESDQIANFKRSRKRQMDTDSDISNSSAAQTRRSSLRARRSSRVS